ncbi:MAG: glycoside hydrolase family 25 protein [Alphaproteobacteria bacterium]|nr:glycoside hydrolase family 25 protein [Alphaproteobacteria bacterium]
MSVIIHRATIGLDIGNFSDADFRFEERLGLAAAHGYGMGAYHVGTRTGTGTQQADDFLKVVKAACDRLSSANRRILLAVDWEPTSSDPDNYMSAVELGNFIRRVIARTGKPILIYSYENFLRDRQGDIAERPGLWQLLGSQPLWVASLRAEGAGLLRDGSGPRLDGLPWRSFVLWQYTDGERTATELLPVSRIDGQPVDRNAFNGSRSALDAFMRAHVWDCVYRIR